MNFNPTITMGNVLAALALMVSLGTTIFAWIATRRSNVEARFQRVDERFKEGSDRMDRHEGRIAGLEQSVKSMPSKDDLHQIEIGMTELAGTMKEIAAVIGANQSSLKSLDAAVSTMREYLLNNK